MRHWRLVTACSAALHSNPSVLARVDLCFAANLDLFLNLIVLMTNREIIVLIGETWRLFESVNKLSITLLRFSAKRLIFHILC